MSAATDHCAHAVSEMTMLDKAWEELRAGRADISVNVSMPVWDSLRKSMPVGTGILSMPVYETMPGADITCLDYSPDMMERAKHRRTDWFIGKIYTPKGYFTPPL